MNYKNHTLTADDWESNINYYQSLAIHSRKWFFSWLTTFLLLSAAWLIWGEFKILHALTLIALSATLISFINFQTTLLRGDMATYHHASMKRLEAIHSKEFL